MSTSETRLTAKQELFIHWYVKLLNATQAAKRAGYSGDMRTLEQVGAENLRKPQIKAEIDKRIKASIVPADQLLSRITSTAIADVTPYIGPDGKLNVQELADAGLGHLVIGVKPGRQGPEYTLAHPQTARKTLARYHKLVGAETQVDVNASLDLDIGALSSLAEQIAAARTETQTDPESEQSDA